MSKGNKHSGKRIYKKDRWVGSKGWREARRAKGRYHAKKNK